MTENEYERIARWLSDHPGEWAEWPETFNNALNASHVFENLRDGGIEAFRVDAASFQWKIDEFSTIVDTSGRFHYEVRCAW